jgi:hypothetical protein
MDDREEMARAMGSLLALTESLLDGVKYEGEDGVRARSLVERVKRALARSNALRVAST